LRGDLIEVFKILKGYENIDQEVFFDMSQSSQFSFSKRAVNEWNILHQEISAGSSLSGFKRKLDRHLRDN